MIKPSQELLRRAREFGVANQPEPIRCMHCDAPQTTGPMASGASWAMNQCAKSPQGMHEYLLTVGNYEETQAAMLAQFAEQIVRECAEIADTHRKNATYVKHDSFTRSDLAKAILRKLGLEP